MKKELYTDLEFTTPEQYYDYIVESETNGQRSQVRELVNDMSKEDKKEAYQYIETNYKENKDANQVLIIIFEEI